jgi:hypothetical protein
MPAPRSCCAAQADKRLLVRVTVEMLLRTGLRVSEYVSLQAGAVVQIGAGPWLHVPVGKLREDRYLPLHPHLTALIDRYRTAHVRPDHPLLLPRENGRALDRHTVTRMINRVGAAAGLSHIHPHQLRHTLATQAINRGMRLEAIAALLGPPQPGHDPALRQDRQPHRRRRVLRRHRESRGPLRPGARAPRRRHRAQDGPGRWGHSWPMDSFRLTVCQMRWPTAQLSGHRCHRFSRFLANSAQRAFCSALTSAGDGSGSSGRR